MNKPSSRLHGGKPQGTTPDDPGDLLAMLGGAFLHSPAATVVTGDDGRIAAANAAMLVLCGFTESEVVGRGPSGLTLDLPPATDSVLDSTQTLRRKDKALRRVRVTSTPIPDANGRPRYTLHTLQPLAPGANDRHWDLLVGRSVDQDDVAVLVTDADGLVLHANPTAAARAGLRVESILDHPAEATKGRSADALRQAMEAGEEWRGDQHRRMGNGQHRWLAVKATPIHDPDGVAAHYVITERDVTSERAAEDAVREAASRDPVTGLLNRTGFTRAMETAVQRAGDTSMALIFLDLDDFKGVNDTLGHDAGDRFLAVVGQRLTEALSDMGAAAGTPALARFGGDEFVILLRNIDTEAQTLAVAEHIKAALRRPVTIDDIRIHTQASAGIAIYPDHGINGAELLRSADMAVFRAKATGGDCAMLFDKEMRSEVLERRALEADLREALEIGGQLSLRFQPQVDLSAGRISGAEALLRWKHPSRGWVSPGHFIPIAESSALIVDLGRWVLRAVCAQLRSWRAAGLPPVPIAVNLSGYEFQQGDLAEKIIGTVQEMEVDPALITLEITETLFMHNRDRAFEVLERLRDNGFKVSLDDFGTGYSSLGYLTEFPVDKIKLDRSFVIGLEEDKAKVAVIDALNDLGHGLGMRVNVEGVETAEQLRLLTRLGVDEIQGYYFSPPLPETEFAALLKTPETFEWTRDLPREPLAPVAEQRLRPRLGAAEELHRALLDRERAVATSDQERASFLAKASHEIRTPLNAILGFAELLGQQAGSDRGRRYAGDIVDSGRQILEQLEAIVDYVTIDIRSRALMPEPVRITSLIEDVALGLQGLADSRNDVIETRLDSTISGLYCDREAVQLMVLKILGRAIEETEGSVIEVEMQRSRDGAELKVRWPAVPRQRGLDGAGQVGDLSSPTVSRIAELHGARLVNRRTSDNMQEVAIAFPSARLRT